MEESMNKNTVWNLTNETELPGRKLTKEALQMICLRYEVISQFVSGRQVLEVGCGPGLGLGYLTRSANRVIGGDITVDHLRYAQEHCKGRIELVRLDAHKLPFKNSYFDVVAAMQVVLYLDIDVFLGECRRVLKEGGTLIINLPNKDRPYFRPSPLSRNYFSAPELFAALDSHGFDAEIFGAFPVPAQPAWSVWQKARIITGKALNLAPKGKWIKARLVNLTSRADVILKEEVGEDIDSGIVENIQLTPIHADSPDHRYQILYAIARAR